MRGCLLLPFVAALVTTTACGHALCDPLEGEPVEGRFALDADGHVPRNAPLDPTLAYGCRELCVEAAERAGTLEHAPDRDDFTIASCTGTVLPPVGDTDGVFDSADPTVDPDRTPHGVAVVRCTLDGWSCTPTL